MNNVQLRLNNWEKYWHIATEKPQSNLLFRQLETMRKLSFVPCVQHYFVTYWVLVS